MSNKNIQIGNKTIGPDQDCFVIAEIGINHNGDLDAALKMIDESKNAGCDAVKFQKRTPELCVPKDQWDKVRETPWGTMTYIDYRHKVEFDHEAYSIIDDHCKKNDILWTASCWDNPSVDFIANFNVPFYKLPSASLTDIDLIRHHMQYEKPLILSTGMSTLEEVDQAINLLDGYPTALLHCNSSYPAKVEELNLKAIETLNERYPIAIGYSGHEVGLSTSLAARVLGACIVERHVTLDRAMWGTDQAASMEPQGLSKLVQYIRTFEKAYGDGVKRVYESELPVREKLRKVK